MEVTFDQQRGRYTKRLRIQKMRGTRISSDELDYAQRSNGLVVYKREVPSYPDKTSSKRAQIGIEGFESILPGGYLKGTVNLVSGPTGSGKTIYCLQFVNKGLELGERCLYVTYEDVPAELRRNSRTLGLKLVSKEDDPKENLKVEAFNAELLGYGEHVASVVELVRSFRPDRVVIDSVSALENALSVMELNLYTKALRSLAKELDITIVCTNLVALLGASHATETRLSSCFDSIVLLKHVEIESTMKRSMVVLKMRGSPHDSTIREFEIFNGFGFRVKSKFEGVENILSGSARRTLTLAEFLREEQNIAKHEAEARTERRRVFETTSPPGVNGAKREGDAPL